MGMRSIICIRYNNELIARYYQWNYGERMVSRARGLLEWFEDEREYLEWNKNKIPLIADINFDYKDVVVSTDIIKEYEQWGEDFSDFVFYSGGNDGKLFIDLDGEDIKYAFTDNDLKVKRGARGYLNWDTPKWKENLKEDEVEFTEDNIKFINKFKQMTQEELEERFIKNKFDNEPKVADKTITFENGDLAGKLKKLVEMAYGGQKVKLYGADSITISVGGENVEIIVEEE